ncbi:hypothetical protein EYF80_030588 [Liparis tanakae]|uniref:Uncharacterized protein n=1 Tax=Liparis tanakae TaxID=230148 RepID=A0A4Z2H1K5_9TELE|nr:hypothetical protein EYF80_030588 [Liparis tanakae]
MLAPEQTENQKQAYRRRVKLRVTSVSIRETITSSLPDSAMSSPELEPINAVRSAAGDDRHAYRGYREKSGGQEETQCVQTRCQNLVERKAAITPKAVRIFG